MHATTIPVTETLIRDALAKIAPALAATDLAPLAHDGTETRVFRLGERHVFRMPLRPETAVAFAQETRILQWLAPHLPLAVPRVLATGHIATDPPLPCSVQTWLEGADAADDMPVDQDNLADTLARCLLALQEAPPIDPIPVSPRGGPLAAQDTAFRDALGDAARKGLGGLDVATAAWEAGLAAAARTEAPVWIHGDLVPGNLIVAGGRLTGLIDWSFATLGDPAYDFTPAWFVLDRSAGRRFLDRMAPDAATRARARARVAWQCVLALPYYLDSNPAMVGLARRGLAALETDMA